MNGQIRFAELFSGIGGFRLGLEQANSSWRTAFPKNNLQPGGCQPDGEGGARRHREDLRSIQQQDGKGRNSYGAENELGQRQPDGSGFKPGSAEGSLVHPGSDFAGKEASVHGCASQDQEGRDTSDNGLGEIFRCVWANELDKYASSIYRRHWNDETLCEGDVRSVKAKDLPEFDLLCAGFPCQSFSIAGKRRGFEDDRGEMFFEVTRIARTKKPKMLLLENVKGLLSAQSGYCFWSILQTLDELRYDVQWMVLNSRDFGVPQNRERVFIIGYSRDFSCGQVFPVSEAGGFATEACAEAPGDGARVRVANPLGVGGSFRERNLLANTLSRRYGKDGSENLIQLNDDGGSQANRVYSPKGISPTVPTACGGRHIPKIIQNQDKIVLKRHRRNEIRNHGQVCPTLTESREHKGGANPPLVAQALQTDGWLRQGSSWNSNLPLSGRNIRRLTPVECERLQGFPDGWTATGLTANGEEVQISDTQRYKCLGNAVTVNVVRFLGERIIENLSR